MAAKKTTRRPPRTIWLVINPNRFAVGVATKKADAVRRCSTDDDYVAGPYNLAERVRQK